MKLTGAGRRLAAVIMTALAVMMLCFALRSTNAAPLSPLPRRAPEPERRGQQALVNINTAGLEELTALPGIGPTRAQAIIDDREANGPYRYPEDLLRVRGIGEGILSDILDQITTGGNANAQNSGG